MLIIDSESKDRTVERARSFGFSVHVIPRAEFTHGGSRALASTLVPWADILIYTTPDAIMASPDTIAHLVAAFNDPTIGAARGRQLPHKDADAFAIHACSMNYPEGSMVRDYEMRKTLGFKTIYLSNNLGAYRRSALEAVGNFPPEIITAEDFWVAAKMMLHGWKIAYVSDATVYHSHNQALPPLFRRYFDIGVMHARESWICEKYGEPSGDGLRFCARRDRLPEAGESLANPCGWSTHYRKVRQLQFGRREAKLPNWVKKRIGNLHEYWDGPRADLRFGRTQQNGQELVAESAGK